MGGSGVSEVICADGFGQHSLPIWGVVMLVEVIGPCGSTV